MDPVLTTVLWLGGIGLLCGVALAIGARFLSVDEDPRAGRIAELLPGANCGGCGFAGCAAYAAAVAKGEAPPDKCAPGGAAVARAVAAVMGKTVESSPERMVAVVKCGGDADAAAKRFGYNGIAYCAAAAAVAGGDKGCPFGCLGYGTCARLCPAHAIEMRNGVAKVRPDLCIGCGLCARSCPRHVIDMVPASAEVHVFCKSADPGAAVRKYCKKGCIGCRLCGKLAAPGCMAFDGTLARVDYGKPFDGDAAIAKCPAKCLGRI